MCFVCASFTAMIGKPSFPSSSSALSRITPVVVSSVPAMISPSCSAPRRVEDADHVGAVVHREVRLVVDGRLDVGVVRVVVLALDREDGHVVLGHERRGDVVLGRERVRGAEDDVAPPACSVRIRFAVSVVTWRQAEMRWPASGCSRSNRSRIAASTGICRSAHSIRRLPSSARARSFTS
jgi:hypothetical protein